MRFIIMILAALGAFWWLKKREESDLSERQEQLPAGVRLLPEKDSDPNPTKSAAARAAAGASAKAPSPPPEASVAAVKTKPSVPAKPGNAKSGGKHDDLTVLTGIGKVFAKRLNEAGIHTYADLAKHTPDRLREITQAKDWQNVDPQAWIDQAKSLSS